MNQRGIVRIRATIILIVVLVIFGAIMVFVAARDQRPPYRRAADAFMQSLAKDNATATYAMFTTNLKKKVSQQDWQRQVHGSFASYQGKPEYRSTVQLSDAYPTYPQDSTPTKVTYRLFIKGKTYDMYIILLAQSNTKWQVDEWDSALQ